MDATEARSSSLSESTTTTVSRSRSLPETLEVDPTVDDLGYDVAFSSSSLVSIASEVSRGLYENGRRYHSYGNAEYALPNDELECERLDMQHAMMTLLLGHRLFWAPISLNPSRILDLGTGTGIWAIDCADIHESAQVIGTDLSPIQPEWVPPNCEFEVDDAEREWTFHRDHFDFIHVRNLVCAIRDWPKLIKQCYGHVKPGGWVEFQQKHPRLYSDDGTLSDDSVLVQFWQNLYEASEKLGSPIDSPEHYKTWMEQAGFVDVEEHVMKLPIGPWPRDPTLKKIGTFELVNLTEGLEGLTVRLFCKYLGWSLQRLRSFCTEVRDEFKDSRIHSYYSFYIVYGRKPEAEE